MESYFCPIILDLYNAKIGINILNKDKYINKLQSLVAPYKQTDRVKIEWKSAESLLKN